MAVTNFNIVDGKDTNSNSECYFAVVTNLI